MLAKIKGTITDIFPDFIIVSNSDLGYKVETVEQDYLVGQEVELFLHTHVRETELRLFGFRKREQFLLFTDLISISGVGPKLALTLLSSLPFDAILNAIENKDITTLKVKGLGQKTAQRIIIDMTSKLSQYKWEQSGQKMVFSEDFISQATGALENLGFGNNEIKRIVREYSVAEENVEDLSKIVKFALKYIKSNDRQ